MKIRRYFYLVALLVVLSGLLAGCLGNSVPTPVPEANQLQVFTWARETYKADLFTTLQAGLLGQRPDLQLIDESATDNEGADPRAVLTNRLLNGQPPDSFQAAVGSDLIDNWVKTDLLEPLDGEAQQQNWATVYPKGLLDMVSADGSIYGVPFGVQRGNLLWYNKKIFSDLKLTPPATLDDFWKTAAAIKAAGITPVSVGAQDRWTVLDTFDNILLANAGPEKYTDLYAGRASWQDDVVSKSLTDLRQYFNFTNASSGYLNWEGAVDFVYEGKAAMTIMGDWAISRFTERGGKLDVDYGWAEAPGTDGQFIVIADAFALPKGAPHQPATLDFLNTLAALPLQTALSKELGTIPARSDADKSGLDTYSTATIDALRQDRLVPSSGHGSATLALFTLRLQDAMSNYLANGDLEGAMKEIVGNADSVLK